MDSPALRAEWFITLVDMCCSDWRGVLGAVRRIAQIVASRNGHEDGQKGLWSVGGCSTPWPKGSPLLVAAVIPASPKCGARSSYLLPEITRGGSWSMLAFLSFPPYLHYKEELGAEGTGSLSESRLHRASYTRCCLL